MRVTNKMFLNTVLGNINSNMRRLEETQNKLSSGKTFTKPSDNPIGTARVLSFNSVLNSQEQYEKNMRDAQGWLDTTDGALDNANKVLQRARELSVYGANGTMSDDSRKALAEEVNMLTEELVQIANTNYGGRYIFGGAHTNLPPFEMEKNIEGQINKVEFMNQEENINEAALLGIYKLEYEVESGVKMNVSAGKNVFHKNQAGDLEINAAFDNMIKLRDALNAGNAAIINNCIGDLDNLIDNTISERAVVGAKSKRIENAQERSSAYTFELTKIVSKLHDVDYAEESMNYSMQQMVYNASLQTGAKTLLPTLVEFLR